MLWGTLSKDHNNRKNTLIKDWPPWSLYPFLRQKPRKLEHGSVIPRFPRIRILLLPCTSMFKANWSFKTGTPTMRVIFITAWQVRKRVKIGLLLNQSKRLLIDKNKIFRQFSKMPSIFNGREILYQCQGFIHHFFICGATKILTVGQEVEK